MKRHRRFMVCVSDPVVNEPLALLPLMAAIMVVGVAVLVTNEGSTSSWLHQAISTITAEILLHSHSHSSVNNNNNTMTSFWMIQAIGIILVAVFFHRIQSKKTAAAATTTTAAVLTIYPCLGVQLSTETFHNKDNPTRRPKIISNRRFLPRDQIVDCLVYELVLSHKVQTVLAIRIHTGDNHDDDDDSKQSSTSQKDLTLIPVFPGTEMTYNECLYMRREIMNALELTD
jgi:hypothetical protein